MGADDIAADKVTLAAFDLHVSIGGNKAVARIQLGQLGHVTHLTDGRNDQFAGNFKFRSGVTSISTPVAQVMQRREGVCQDFTHVMISCLRGMGLPARYVSGYIRTRPPPGQPRRQGADQSHAWVGCWMGPALGWIDLDPTNNLIVSNEHVVLGWGRDFADISPVQGVILGGGRHTLSVSVDLEPEGEED